MKQKCKVTTLPDKYGKPLYVFLKYEEYLALTEEVKANKTSAKSVVSQATSVPKAGGRIPDAVLTRVKKGNVSPMRAWREYLGLSQAEVARRLNITPGGYNFLEKARTPRLVTAEKVAKAMGINPTKLSI